MATRPSKLAKTEMMIEDIAKAWLKVDYVPQTKKVVQDLLDAGDKPVLHADLDPFARIPSTGTRGSRKTEEQVFQICCE
jgi:hypothetical protein